jgi:hypothetical protein
MDANDPRIVLNPRNIKTIGNRLQWVGQSVNLPTPHAETTRPVMILSAKLIQPARVGFFLGLDGPPDPSDELGLTSAIVRWGLDGIFREAQVDFMEGQRGDVVAETVEISGLRENYSLDAEDIRVYAAVAEASGSGSKLQRTIQYIQFPIAPAADADIIGPAPLQALPKYASCIRAMYWDDDNFTGILRFRDAANVTMGTVHVDNARMENMCIPIPGDTSRINLLNTGPAITWGRLIFEISL